jgi:hypothetical protein
MFSASCRRIVTLIACAMGPLVLGASVAIAGPTFKAGSISVTGASALVDLSPDREVVTVVASNLAATLEPSRQERQSGGKATLRARFSDARSGARVHLTIDAHSDIEPGVRGVLIVRVNGSRRRFRMPVGPGGPGRLEATFELSGSPRLLLDVEISLARPKGSQAAGVMGVDVVEATLRPL